MRSHAAETESVGTDSVASPGPPLTRRADALPARGQTKGEILWRRDGVNTYPAVRYALARIARGKPPVLATIFLRPGDFSPASRRTLRFLDPDTGAEIRKVELPTGVEPFKDDPDRRDSPDCFQISALNAVDFDGDGIDEIVVNYQHVPEAPSYAVLYEPLLDRSMATGGVHRRRHQQRLRLVQRPRRDPAATANRPVERRIHRTLRRSILPICRT